jgi:hypothetical protein
MGKAKKTRKFAEVKRLISPKEALKYVLPGLAQRPWPRHGRSDPEPPPPSAAGPSRKSRSRRRRQCGMCE